MSKIIKNQYIDTETLSKNLDKVIVNESNLLKNNLKNGELIASNLEVNYV